MKTLTYSDGTWHDGSPALITPHTQAFWLGSAAFDGARYFEGVAPDLTRHCQRVVDSARILHLNPMLTGPEIAEIAWEGIRQFSGKAALYICPLYYAEGGFIIPDGETTRFVLSLFEMPMKEKPGFTAHLSRYRRPARDMAPTTAKATCLYPNVARVLHRAKAEGFDTGVVLDPNGNVAEFAYANLFYVRDEVVYTPPSNGTFLNGITRRRVMRLLATDGIEVREKVFPFHHLLEADEIFATGNLFKVDPCLRLENRDLPHGPIATRARELYWEFARASG